jgi:chromosome segregation ATPase
LQTSTTALERQKQIGTQLQQQIAELNESAKMAAAGGEQVAELTKNVQLLKTQNVELNTKVTDLQNAVRQKETQIANMGSGDDAQLADLKELLKESETSNKELNIINRELSLKLKDAETAAAEMSAPQDSPELDQLRSDKNQLDLQIQQLGQEKQQLGKENQQLGQQKQQLESENSQLKDMLGKLRLENSELDATVTRLSNMPPPQEATGFAAKPIEAASSAELAGLRNQLAALTRRNGQLERQLKKSKSKYSSLADDNARLVKDKDADSESTIEVAAAPLAVAPVKADVSPVSVAVPELGLGSVSAGWPVKYWIFAMLGVGLLVGLGVAWYESVVDPKGVRRTSNSASNP